jgi:hypothetical protein
MFYSILFISDKESKDEQNVHEHEIHGSSKEQQVNQSEIQPSNLLQDQHVNDQENQASDKRVNERETCASNVEQHINEY